MSFDSVIWFDDSMFNINTCLSIYIFFLNIRIIKIIFNGMDFAIVKYVCYLNWLNY